jgi:group I intron endonuclease
MGVYQVRNIKTNKAYVGSTINLNKRKWEHFNTLKNNTHFNVNLQDAFSEYGQENFKFEVLERVLIKENLIEREQYFMNTIVSKYNTCKIAGSTKGHKRSLETRQKMSKSKLGTKNTRSKLDEIKVMAIKTMLKKHRMADIARFFKVNFQTIYSIKKGITWKQVPTMPRNPFLSDEAE